MILPDDVTERVLAQIKRIMSEKGLSYAQLAREMQVSIATVKRLLNGDDISLVRFSQVCAFLEVDAVELLASTKLEPREKARLLSEAEEEFFIRHPHHLGYFVELARGRSPGLIARKYKLSKRSTSIYLSNLEREGFIRVLPGHKVKILVHTTGAWRPGGPLMRRHAEGITTHIARRFEGRLLGKLPPFDLRSPDPLAGLGSVHYYYSRPATRQAYIQEVRDATVRFLRICVQEVHTDGEDSLEPMLLALFLESGEDYREFFSGTLSVKELEP